VTANKRNELAKRLMETMIEIGDVIDARLARIEDSQGCEGMLVVAAALHAHFTFITDAVPGSVERTRNLGCSLARSSYEVKDQTYWQHFGEMPKA
jgi:hypothetical protein